MKFKPTLAALALTLCSWMSGAQAQTYSFSCITNNSASDCLSGQAELSLTLVDYGSTVGFVFSNTGTDASFIAQIYFDWSSSQFALSGGTVTNTVGTVSFTEGANPGDLPGGNSIGFVSDVDYGATNPSPKYGINAGESLTLSFAGSFSNLLAGLDSGGLTVGLHVQGFDGGGSESFTTVTPVPEPQTYALMLAGLVAVGFMARRRRAE